MVGYVKGQDGSTLVIHTSKRLNSSQLSFWATDIHAAQSFDCSYQNISGIRAPRWNSWAVNTTPSESMWATTADVHLGESTKPCSTRNLFWDATLWVTQSDHSAGCQLLKPKWRTASNKIAITLPVTKGFQLLSLRPSWWENAHFGGFLEASLSAEISWLGLKELHWLHPLPSELVSQTTLTKM